MTRNQLLAIALTALSAGGARAQYSSAIAPRNGDAGSHADKKTGFDMKRGNSVPLDLEFFDHNDKEVGHAAMCVCASILWDVARHHDAI